MESSGQLFLSGLPELSTQGIIWVAIFSGIVLIVFWVEYRRVRARLLRREEQMKQRMYEISILREIGERIGYSLNVEKIIDIIGKSLGNLLPYSAVAYMLPTREGRFSFNINLTEPVSKKLVAEVRDSMVKSFSALFGKGISPEEIEESITGTITDPLSKQGLESIFHVPIVINERPAGILTVASHKIGLYRTNEQVDILYTIVNQASEAVSKLQTVLDLEKGKLNAMVASMADGVVMIDSQNQLMVINPRAKKMLGVDNPQVSVFDIFSAMSDRMDLRAKIEESVKRDQVVAEDEIELGGIFMQILISPVKDKKNDLIGSVVLLHDITKEKEVEKMREDFTSMMVHELRSPLTGIRSIASLLKGEKIKNDEKKYSEFIGLISSNSESMLGLVNDLLDVAKLEAGKFQVLKAPADLRKIVLHRVESFESLAQESGISIDQNISSEVPQSLAFDEMKISQVLNNLLSNAIKYSGAGTTVTVSAFICKRGKQISEEVLARKLVWRGIRQSSPCQSDSVIVGVTDTGVGIPEAEISKLFSKFQQLSTATKSEKKGTGLGLVIVKGVVEAHGGLIGVFSEEGAGSTFYFALPLVQ